MHTSVSLKTAATTELKQEAPCHSHIPQVTSPRQRVLTSQFERELPSRYPKTRTKLMEITPRRALSAKTGLNDTNNRYPRMSLN